MIKNILTVTCFLFSSMMAAAQSTDLPVKELISAVQNPFVFYISGDGGFNSFSTDLTTAINKAGYNITLLNAKSYFWDKKTPEQTATDIIIYVKTKINNKKDQHIILVGYSFGADVIPFIVNRFPDSLKRKIVSVLLLSPSATTDFEIHLSDMFGSPKKRSMDVVAEINRMGTQKTAIIFGGDEDGFSAKDIKLKTCSYEILPGGHHFAGNTDELAKVMMKYFK